jgi:rhomboid protease GluP
MTPLLDKQPRPTSNSKAPSPSLSTEHPPLQNEASEVSFAVEYQKFAGSLQNCDLQGKGLLIISGNGASLRFSGRRRGLLTEGVTECNFAAEEIANVVTDGNRVSFSTSKGRSGKLNKPFVFFCRDGDDARVVAAMLPVRLDADFVATRDFAATLGDLSGPAHPARSATNIIIGVNVAVFLVMAGFLGGGWVQVTNMTPYMRYGANNAAATADGELWRLVTCMFLHYGAVHLALNMWALYQTGHLVERLLGRTLFVLTYFASGIGGGLLSMIWHGDKVWSVGASGAIFGVYGALLGYMLRERQSLPPPVYRPLLKSTLLFAGYNLFYGFVNPAIDNAAHIGGLVSGVAFGWICAMPVDKAVRAKLVGERFLLATIALLVMTCAGLSLTPKYPYVVRDELAWSSALGDFPQEEARLLNLRNVEVKRWQERGDNAESLESLATQDLGPLYADLGVRVSAIALTPNRLTDHRRKLLLQIIGVKTDAYRHLDRAARERNQWEFQEYIELESRSSVLIESLKKLKT